MKNTHNAEPRKHYYLIYGSVVFQRVGTEEIGSIDINGLLIQDNKNIALHELNNAQRVLQHNFFKRISPDEVEVRDVVIANYVYMGSYTDMEFRNIPEDVSMQVRKAEEAAASKAEAASEAIIDQIVESSNDNPEPKQPLDTPNENPDRIESQPEG